MLPPSCVIISLAGCAFLTVRSQRQVLVECIEGSRGRHELALLVDRRLSCEAQAVLIIGLGILRIVGSGGRWRL